MSFRKSPRLPDLAPALRKLRLRDLEMLAELGHTCSFGQTAEANAITQPALSKWLRDLEGELGVVLFERTTRRVAPTPSGEIALACAARVLTDMARLPQSLDALRQGHGQPVSLGVLPGMGAVLVPTAMRWLQQQAVQPQVRLLEGTLDQLLPQAQRHELDLILCHIGSAARNSGLAIQELYEDEVRVFVGAHHPLLRQRRVTWKNAVCFPWILPPAGSPMRTALELELARAGLPIPAMALESSSLPINAMAARSTDCLFVAASQSARFAPESQTLRALPLHLASAPKAIGLLYAMPSKGAVDALRQALQEAARTLPSSPWGRTGSLVR